MFLIFVTLKVSHFYKLNF